MNPKDIIKLNVPLFLRLLEYAKEDAKTDMDLHKVTENIIQLASSGQVLGMQEYQMIVGDHDELNEEFIRMQELAGLKDEFQTIKVYDENLEDESRESEMLRLLIRIENILNYDSIEPNSPIALEIFDVIKNQQKSKLNKNY